MKISMERVGILLIYLFILLARSVCVFKNISRIEKFCDIIIYSHRNISIFKRAKQTIQHVESVYRYNIVYVCIYILEMPYLMFVLLKLFINIAFGNAQHERNIFFVCFSAHFVDSLAIRIMVKIISNIFIH